MPLEMHKRFAAAVEAALAGATVVTATTRAARMLLAESLRRLRAGKPACRTPDILPLEAFYQRLWNDLLAAGAAPEALLSEYRGNALWRKVIAASRHSAALSSQGSARMAQDAWRVANAYRIPLEARAFRGVAESAAFFEWASLYKEECEGSGWVDAATLPEQVVRRLGQAGAIAPKRLVLYGFDALMPQTAEFLRELEKRGVRVETISTDISSAAEGAGVISAESAHEELQLAATWARRMLIEDASHRIGVVVPRLREIRDQVEAAFAAVLHPEEFLSPAVNKDRAFEIAAGRPLDEYALVRHALAILRFTFAAADISDVGMLLRSPYVGEPAEACARAMFDVALRRDGRQQFSAQTLPSTTGERSYRATLPSDFARRVRQLSNLRTPPAKLLQPSDAAEQFHKALVTANWPGETLDSGEYQLREKWEDLLGHFASLDGFVPAQNAPAMIDELARMAAAVSFRPENSGAPVQIMDDDEAAGAIFDRLWISGLTDEWPRRTRPNPYLPIALQRAAGVPNLGHGEQHAAAVAALARFAASAPQVIFSWPHHDRDLEFRPNRLLLAFDTADPAEVCGPPPPNVASLERDAAELEYLDDRNAPAADPELLPHRGTEVLKYQAHCPFRAFAQLRLGARELESPPLGLDRRVRGKLVEKALEIFWGHFRDSVNLRDLTPSDRLAEILDDSVEKSFREYWPEAAGVWNERLRALEQRRLRSLLKRWCDVELRRADFEVMLDEQQKEIDVELGPVKIHGRIDRVDRVRGGGFVVIDYKSGATPKPANWLSERPEEPQLPLYAVHQLAQGREVSGVAFAHVTTAEPAWKGYSDPLTILGISRDTFKRNLNGGSWRQFVHRWQVTLENLARDFVAGEAAVDPKRPFGNNSTCRYCHLHSFCRVAEVSFAATDDEAAAGGDDE